MSSSIGYTVRRSTTSTDTPRPASASAASRALCTIAPYVTIVTSSPVRFTAAELIGTSTSGSSGTCSLIRRYSALCSRNRLGLSSRIADFNSPFASDGNAGHMILIPPA